MEREQLIENVKNFVNGSIDAKGNVIVGDGNTIVVNIYKFEDYKKLKSKVQSLEKSLTEAQQAYQQNTIAYIVKQIADLYQEIENTRKEIDLFEREIVALAYDLTKKPANTERLQKAQAYFLEGKQHEARTFLKAEKELMQQERTSLHLHESQLSQEVTSNKEALRNNANEYLLLARLTAIDFTNPNRIADTRKEFEESLKSQRNEENLFFYALFLQKNNFFNEAIKDYEEALVIIRRLALENPAIYLHNMVMLLNNLASLHSVKNELGQAESEYQEALAIGRRLASGNPAVYLTDVAMTLNNLAVLHTDKNELGQAESEYQEALDIKRRLASENPAVYLPDLAMTLNNLAALHSVTNEFGQAENEYQEALTIRRRLASDNPAVYLFDVTETLNNLAILHKLKNELGQAEGEYQEALTIRRHLASENPAVYLPYVATTLNNLANLHSTKKEVEQAESEYEEALAIRRRLATGNPAVYLPYVAATLINLGIFYIEPKHSKERSVAFAKEALDISRPFLEKAPYTQEYAQTADQILQHWEQSEKKGFWSRFKTWFSSK